MKARLITISFLVLLLSASCEKLTAPFTDSPVIESYLSPGTTPLVKVSRQIPFASDAVYSEDDIDKLQITIKKGSETHTMVPAGDGTYTDSSVTGEGDEFTLSFVYNFRKVVATTSIPAKPVNFAASDDEISVMRWTEGSTPGFGSFTSMEPISLTWDNDDNSYYIVVIECVEDVLDPVREYSDSIPPMGMFRKRPTTSQGIEIRPQEFQYFGKHRIILFHVLPDYASLYDEKISSSQNLTNPSTSIANGYGIFTGLNSDTLYIQVNESAR
jgi:hypothetical protein